MYTLRTFNEECIESNLFLGRSYQFINREARNQEAFRKAYKKAFKEDHVSDIDDNATEASKNCWGFLYDENGNLIYLSKKETYYVVSSDGKTFSNLTYRG